MIVEVDSKTKFRATVVLRKGILEETKVEYDANRVRQCNSRIGHVLYVESPGVIACHNCPAKWKDEGF